MQFRLACSTRLAPPTLFTTREEAAAEGKLAFAVGDHGFFETFHVEQVRPAKMSDFFSMAHVIGDLRENMATKCGDDSAMDARESSPNLAPNEGPRVFDNPQLEIALGRVLDDFVELSGVDMSSLMIVETRHAVRHQS
jgi:hypothetical protein